VKARPTLGVIVVVVISLTPLSMCKKCDLGEMRPTTISLQLADLYVKYPVDVLEDSPLRYEIYMYQLTS